VVTRSYWALIIGFVAERLIWTLCTYAFHPYRPRVDWSAVRELWSFSQWIPMQNAGRYLKNTLDSFLIGRFLGAPQLGIYSMGSSAAGIANAELVAPVSGALFPSYAKLAHEPERLARAYVDALGMLALLLCAGAIGMMAIAPTFVPVVLGPRWLETVPVAQCLSLYVVLNGLSASVANMLMVLGRMRRLTVTIYLQLIVYAPVLLLVAWRGGLVEMAAAKALLALLVAPGLFASLTAVSLVTTRQIVSVLVRPMVASVIMLGAVTLLQRSWSTVSGAALAAQIAVGGAVFIAATAALWSMVGRPAGAERTVIEWAAGRLTALRDRCTR
jgi:O-antigen/teichoic acid export membrane protein